MHQPELYKKSSKLQRKASEDVIDQYFDYIQLRSDGKDSLLDVGCGPGDVLMDFIHTKLPITASKVVGIDISPSMVKYSKEMYVQHENVDFKVFDITTPILPMEFCEQFDHVVSFYCLNWVHNQKQAFKNIYNMMAKNGDFLILFPFSSPMYDSWKAMSMNSKWAKYMQDIHRFIPISQNSSDPRLMYTKILQNLGFGDIKIEVHEDCHYYKGSNIFGDFLLSINPFVEKMPFSEQMELKLELLEWWKSKGLCKEVSKIGNYEYEFSYKKIIVCGRK